MVLATQSQADIMQEEWMLELQNFSLKRNKRNQTTTKEHRAKINQLLIPNINMNLSNILREQIMPLTKDLYAK